MAGEALMLVQQVLLPQMQLLVLLVPQVRPLVLRRRVYYHVTYFAFAITPPDRLSNNDPHLLFHQQNVDLSLTIILLFTCFFLACHCHREFVH